MGDDKNKRIDFVDLTKGVCIILVVMAHIGGAFEKLDYHSMIASFRMPLYFFISGIFFKSYEGLFGFFIRKINKLIVPFLFFYLSAFLLKYIVWKIAPGVFLVFAGTFQLQYPVLSGPQPARPEVRFNVCPHPPDRNRRILYG